jgi:RNA recognition motif-containing protein
MSRSIKVEEAQGKKNNDFGNKGGSFGGAPKQFSTEPAKIESNTLFIGGLSYNSTVDSIKGLFASVGEVTSARIVTDK